MFTLLVVLAPVLRRLSATVLGGRAHQLQHLCRVALPLRSLLLSLIGSFPVVALLLRPTAVPPLKPAPQAPLPAVLWLRNLLPVLADIALPLLLQLVLPGGHETRPPRRSFLAYQELLVELPVRLQLHARRY